MRITQSLIVGIILATQLYQSSHGATMLDGNALHREVAQQFAPYFAALHLAEYVRHNEIAARSASSAYALPAARANMARRTLMPSVENLAETDPCSICLTSIDDTEGRATLNCKHTFHQSCIVRWFDVRRTCPNCVAVEPEGEEGVLLDGEEDILPD